MRACHVCIPARFNSSRLPGKPLREVAGKPLILWAIESAAQLPSEGLYVATDDQRIAACVEAAGHRVIMTASTHQSGTDRLAECARIKQWHDEDIVLNYQGDEPMIDVRNLQCVVDALREDSRAAMATLYQPLRSVEDLLDENVVKLVTRDDGSAAYFSRAPIPWRKGGFNVESADDIAAALALHKHHVGLYAYTVGFLKRYTTWPVHPLEQAESLEQLRALMHGERILALPAAAPLAHGIDTEADVARFEARLQAGE